MKKILTIAFLMSFAIAAKAEIFSGTCGTNLTWTLNTADSTLTISGTGAMTDYGEHYRAPWYREKEYIKYVNVPNGVTTVGAAAFMGCINMTSFVIPNTVTKLGGLAFYRSGIKTIHIPASVISIQAQCFIVCLNLESITVAADNTAYSAVNGVLYNKAKTTLVAYPCGNPSTTFSIPSSVITLAADACRACLKLNKVVIPASVTSCSGAFLQCNNLLTIEVNSGNTKYSSQDGVLYNKDKTSIICYPAGKTTTSITIPSTVTTIGGNCFAGCKNLKSISIPNTVTSIGGHSFWDAGITTISIPASVTTIGNYAFDAADLTSINVAASNPNYASIDGVLYNKDKTILIAYPKGHPRSSFTIPNTVVEIYRWALASSKNLTSITLDTNLKTISESAFSSCSNLLSINIPASVISLGNGAFDGCTSLLDIIMNTPTPPSVGTDVFYDSYDKALAVPCGATAAYQADPIFGQFENIIEQCYYDVTVESENAAKGTAAGGGTNLLGGSVIELTATPNSCYQFKQWSDGNTNNPRNYLVERTATVIAEFEKVQYTITFNPNGGTLDTPTKNITCGSTYGTLPTPTRTGYTFDGWYTAASGGTKVESTSTVSITANQMLYALWKANTYTVTFNANGGLIPTGGNLGTTPAGHTTTLSADRKIGTVVVTSGQKGFRLMTNDCPTREGYSFRGWYTAPNGGEQVYDATGNYIECAYWDADGKWIGTSDLTVYAHWQYIIFTISDDCSQNGTTYDFDE